MARIKTGKHSKANMQDKASMHDKLDMPGEAGAQEARGTRKAQHATGFKEMAVAFDAWKADNETAACVLVSAAVCIALVGLFVYIVFSGFGSSADFIYSQF